MAEALVGRRDEDRADHQVQDGRTPREQRRPRGTSSRGPVIWAVEASLRRLLRLVDLYQIHSPDPPTPIKETLFRASTTPVRAGEGAATSVTPTSSVTQTADAG